MKKRIDTLLVDKGLARSRNQAVQLIKEGFVFVDGKQVAKASVEVKAGDAGPAIEVRGAMPYVSRAGQKLGHALEHFKIAVTDKTAIDIGASTGGFTDCLLQNGASKVYAIDVGTDQLVPELKNHPKVISLEKTDVRDVSITEKVDIVTIDVSFISLTHILSIAYTMLKEHGSVIALIKPQFEVGQDNIDKKGIVKDESKRIAALDKIIAESKKIGFEVVGTTPSPITGSTGNVEYLIYLKK